MSNSTVSTSEPSKASASSTSTSSGKSWMKNLFSGPQVKQSSSASSTNPQGAFDLSYITSRLIVLSIPRESVSESSCRLAMEPIREFLHTKHGQFYMIYALDQCPQDQVPFRKEQFPNQIMDLQLLDGKQSLHLADLLSLCAKVTCYLLESSSNVAVLHSSDAKGQLAFAACFLLAFHHLFAEVDQIIEYYESRRCAQSVLTQSQKRYIQYVCHLSSTMLQRIPSGETVIKSLSLAPVPLFNRQRNGCRPYIDVYNDEQKKIFSTYQESNKLRTYSVDDGVCLIPVNLAFRGDITIYVLHAPIGLSFQAVNGGIRMCHLTIHSQFSTDQQQSTLSYSKNELDGMDQQEKYPPGFRVIIEMVVSNPPPSHEPHPFDQGLSNTIERPLVLFRDGTDFKQTMTDYEQRGKQPNGEETSNSEHPLSQSVSFRRPTKSKEDLSASLESTSSSARSVHRFSGSTSPIPQSPSSFVNPRHNPFKCAADISPRSSELFPSSAERETKQGDRSSGVGDLLQLDDGDGDSNSGSALERSTSSDVKQQELMSSVDSQTNLLDTDFHSIATEPAALPRSQSAACLPTPMQASTLIGTQLKPSAPSKAAPTPGPAVAVNYDIKMTTEMFPASSPPNAATNPQKSNPTATRWQTTKSDMNLAFAGIDGMPNSTSKPKVVVPTSIADVQKAKLAESLDPTVRRVRDWTDGKKRNIRALLCSLASVTWPECTWTGCHMHELITTDQVKKVYRKAVLHIHPDKLRDDPNEQLAKLIFVELNEAWAQFQSEANE